MVVKTKDKEGNEVLMFDPTAVYLDPDELDDSQARFRIFGPAKLKRVGLKIIQDNTVTMRIIWSTGMGDGNAHGDQR